MWRCAAIDEPDPAYYIPVGHAGRQRRRPRARVVAGLLADETVAKHGYDLKQELLAWAARGVTVAALGFDCMLAAYLCITTRTRVPTLTVLGPRPLRSRRAARGGAAGQRPGATQPRRGAHRGGGARTTATGWRWSRPCAQRWRPSSPRGRCARCSTPSRCRWCRSWPPWSGSASGSTATSSPGSPPSCSARITELEATSRRPRGTPSTPARTQQLATFLYDNLGLAAGRRTKTGRSTDADTLEALRGEHPVVDVILEWRQLTKLKSTYVDALPLLCAADWSRAHLLQPGGGHHRPAQLG